MEHTNTAKLRHAVAQTIGKNRGVPEGQIARLIETRESSVFLDWAV